MRFPFLLLISVIGLAPCLPAASIRTVIGTGSPGFDERSVNNPYGLIIGPDGALYFCDIGNHAIRRLDLRSNRVTTVAGDLKEPYEIRFDRAGDLFFVDMPAHRVHRIDRRTRALIPVAGTGEPGFSGDGGPAGRAQLRNPHSIAFDRAGRLLICDIGNHRVRRVDLSTGGIHTWLGTGERKPTEDGDLTPATAVNGPRAIDVDRDGNIYLALREGNAVYRIDAGGARIVRIAGTGARGYSGDGGPGLGATLNGPKGVALSRDGSLYIADTENHAIRRLDLKTGTITTAAGTGERGDGPDGDPLRCRMNRPHGVFAARDGKVYIGDSEAHRIRVLIP
jgi:DNA-binding beta-propeller fold protein YncE